MSTKKTTKIIGNYLIEQLLKLEPSKINGFEGLMKLLIEELTGERFYLAKAGYQAGKDVSNNYIAIEAKRYGNTTLNETELLGKISQAQIDNSSLEMWVLATTTIVDNQLNDKLEKKANQEGIEYFAIEAGNGDPSSLEILCASFENSLINFLKNNCKNFLTKDKKKLKYDLEKIRRKEDYKKKLLDLKESFSKETIGLDRWHKKQKEWLLDQFVSERKSKLNLGQVINVDDPKKKIVIRKSALNEIDSWLSNWGKKHEIFSLVGEEGDGKTWAVASWISKYIKENNKKPVLFIPARSMSDEGLNITLNKAVFKERYPLKEIFYKKKFSNWMNRDVTIEPLMIVVIDGLNQSYNFDWVRLLEELQNEKWTEKIAVIITCRKSYWNQKLSNLKFVKSKVWTLQPFNDSELEEALSNNNLNKLDFSRQVNELIRKPRYLSLVVKHYETLTNSGDITISRLIYEDFKDRASRISGTIITDQDFEELICELAEKYSHGQTKIKDHDLHDFTPSSNERWRIVEELKTSGILINDKIRTGIFKVDQLRLNYGLGILLLEKIRDKNPQTMEEIEENLALFLEPNPEMDIKVKIVSSALFHSIKKRESISEKIRLSLLKYWLSLVNIANEDLDEFVAYFPNCPELYFQFAELEDTNHQNNDFAHRLLLYTFVKWGNESSAKKYFKDIFEKWLGYINVSGYFEARSSHEHKYLNKSKERIRKTLDCNKEFLGDIRFLGLDFILTESWRKIELSRLALQTISHIAHGSFFKAIVKGVISDEIMGYPRKGSFFGWIIKHNGDTYGVKIKEEAETLVKTGNLILKKAAYRLLKYEGSP